MIVSRDRIREHLARALRLSTDYEAAVDTVALAVGIDRELDIEASEDHFPDAKEMVEETAA